MVQDQHAGRPSVEVPVSGGTEEAAAMEVG